MANYQLTQTGAQVQNLLNDISNKAPLTNPSFSGIPTAPTASVGTNTTQIATTEFVKDMFENGSERAYVKTAANQVINTLTQHQSSRTFNIGIMSDLHIYTNRDYDYDYTNKATYYNYHSARHACQGMAYISKAIHLNACAMLGDYIVGNYNNWLSYEGDGVASINRLASEIQSDQNIRLIGNHDQGYDGTQLDPSYLYPFITGFNKNMIAGDFNRGYGYFDNNIYKLRIIILNTCEYNSNTSDRSGIVMSNAQNKWFAQALDLSEKSDAAEWQILILSHHPLDWETSNTAITTIQANILAAYEYGNTITIDGTVFNFGNKNKSIIIGNIHGHLHNYLTGTITGTHYKRWCCPAVCYDSSNRYYDVWRESTTYGKTIRSGEDTAFAIFAIDLDNHTVSRIHYGAGYDTIDDIYYNQQTSYTNVVLTSIDSDGTIYNEVGYANGYRLNSQGSPVAQIGSVTTGYIPVSNGDVVRIKGIDWNVEDIDSEYSDILCYFDYITSSFELTPYVNRNDQYSLPAKENGIYTITINSTTTSYIRFNGVGNGENLIVTINEQIIDNPDTVNHDYHIVKSEDLESYSKKEIRNLYAPINSPALTGTPTAPTASVGTGTTQIATTAFVQTSIADKVDKEAGKGLSTNDFTDSDKNLLEAGCTETKNRFNLGTDIILGKNNLGGNIDTRAITKPLYTGNGSSVVYVKSLPANLKYKIYAYPGEDFSSPTDYTASGWIDQRGQSMAINNASKKYIRVLFGTVNNATITMADFEGLELQVEEGEQKTDYAPKYTAFDYVARNRSYPVHLKVCSYNVGMYSNGISTDTPAADALENMSGFLGANNFDILGIQEGRNYVNGTNADETTYNDYFISQKSLLNNCAIKSQFVLKNTGEGTFTAGSRKYVYATAIIGNKEVFIINVHLALTAADRASNYTELLALLKAHEYFIVFGDFNAAIDYNTGAEEQTQAEYNNLINAGYTVANGGRWGLLTTLGTQTKYPDNICVSNNIKMITSKTADVYATMNSDHIPVIAELVV